MGHYQKSIYMAQGERDVIARGELSNFLPVRMAQLAAADRVKGLIDEARTVATAADRSDVYEIQRRVNSGLCEIKQGAAIEPFCAQMTDVVIDTERGLWPRMLAIRGIGLAQTVAGKMLTDESDLATKLKDGVLASAQTYSEGPIMLSAALDSGVLTASGLNEQVRDWTEAGLASDEEAARLIFSRRGIRRLVARELANQPELPMLVKNWQLVKGWDNEKIDQADTEKGEGTPRLVIRMGPASGRSNDERVVRIRTPRLEMMRSIQASGGLPRKDKYYAGSMREDRGPSAVIAISSSAVEPPFNKEKRAGISIPGVVVNEEYMDVNNLGWEDDEILKQASVGGLQYISAIWMSRLLGSGIMVDSRQVERAEKKIIRWLTEPFCVYQRRGGNLEPIEGMQEIRLIDPYMRELNRIERRSGVSETCQVKVEDTLRASMRALALNTEDEDHAVPRTETQIMRLCRAVCKEKVIPAEDRPWLRTLDPMSDRVLMLVETAKRRTTWSGAPTVLEVTS